VSVAHSILYQLREHIVPDSLWGMGDRDETYNSIGVLGKLHLRMPFLPHVVCNFAPGTDD
jgi:hypothetical protein